MSGLCFLFVSHLSTCFSLLLLLSLPLPFPLLLPSFSGNFGSKGKLTRYITSTTRIPILKPSTPHTSIFVIDGQLYIAQSFGDTNAVVDS
jgi:hypothetical protein